jgi:hypothetical protein
MPKPIDFKLPVTCPKCRKESTADNVPLEVPAFVFYCSKFRIFADECCSGRDYVLCAKISETILNE